LDRGTDALITFCRFKWPELRGNREGKHSERVSEPNYREDSPPTGLWSIRTSSNHVHRKPRSRAQRVEILPKKRESSLKPKRAPRRCPTANAKKEATKKENSVAGVLQVIRRGITYRRPNARRARAQSICSRAAAKGRGGSGGEKGLKS